MRFLLDVEGGSKESSWVALRASGTGCGGASGSSLAKINIITLQNRRSFEILKELINAAMKIKGRART